MLRHIQDTIEWRVTETITRNFDSALHFPCLSNLKQ